jgi:hypothetical protein
MVILIQGHNLTIVVMKSQGSPYSNDMVTGLLHGHSRICNVLLRTTVDDIRGSHQHLYTRGHDFYYIDALTSHYSERPQETDCHYLSTLDIDEVLRSCTHHVEQKKCSLIVIDDLLSLLLYYSQFDIERMTSSLRSDPAYAGVDKIVLAFMDNELVKVDSERLLSDVRMMADRVIEL